MARLNSAGVTFQKPAVHFCLQVVSCDFARTSRGQQFVEEMEFGIGPGACGNHEHSCHEEKKSTTTLCRH